MAYRMPLAGILYYATNDATNCVFVGKHAKKKGKMTPEPSRSGPQLGADYSVSAYCPTCWAITNFVPKATESIQARHEHEGRSYDLVLYVFGKCVRCGRGSLATVGDNGRSAGGVLEDFFPFSIDPLPLPQSVPGDIQTEFRGAEQCASFGANRAASALFRSVLEKTLKANGYTKGNDPTLKDLQKRIDAAAADGVITDARRKKAHDDIRALGNDVLHDDWRQVTFEEVEDSRRYTQRILEDLYDDRPTVEAILVAKNRLQPPASKPQPAPSPKP
jgi:Domain of unknown function (DUF4145)